MSQCMKSLYPTAVMCENSLIQWNVWIHWLPRENISTMSPPLVGHNFTSVDILLTFTLCQCNVITLLDNLSGTGASYTKWHSLHFHVITSNSINSLWPNHAIWQHRSGLTLSQVMACCLTAPSHYLNHCWLIVKCVLWHLPESKSTNCNNMSARRKRVV